MRTGLAKGGIGVVVVLLILLVASAILTVVGFATEGLLRLAVVGMLQRRLLEKKAPVPASSP